MKKMLDVEMQQIPNKQNLQEHEGKEINDPSLFGIKVSLPCSNSPFADVGRHGRDEPEQVEAELVGGAKGQTSHHRYQGKLHQRSSDFAYKTFIQLSSINRQLNV